jgi:hypothetical protein
VLQDYDPDNFWADDTLNAKIWKTPLQGLAVASQLTRLVLNSPLIENVSFIRACKHLEVLDLSGCVQLKVSGGKSSPSVPCPCPARACLSPPPPPVLT